MIKFKNKYMLAFGK